MSTFIRLSRFSFKRGRNDDSVDKTSVWLLCILNPILKKLWKWRGKNCSTSGIKKDLQQERGKKTFTGSNYQQCNWLRRETPQQVSWTPFKYLWQKTVLLFFYSNCPYKQNKTKILPLWMESATSRDPPKASSSAFRAWRTSASVWLRFSDNWRQQQCVRTCVRAHACEPCHLWVCTLAHLQLQARARQ